MRTYKLQRAKLQVKDGTADLINDYLNFSTQIIRSKILNRF